MVFYFFVEIKQLLATIIGNSPKVKLRGVFFYCQNLSRVSFKIAIASGKGGTGKTTVSVNLFHFFGQKLPDSVVLFDCDVEEPNDALFFSHSEKIGTEQVFQIIPEIDTAKCTFCKKCSEWCEFNAITIVKKLQFAKIDSDLCHSCGACSVACQFGAITENQQPLGEISHITATSGNLLVEGRLKVGSAMQTSLIKEVKKLAANHSGIALFDAPPGTSCPVVETVSDADYVIMVTEPTPFGIHDLKIAVEMLNNLQKPFGVVVNKAGLGSNEIYEFLEINDIELLAKIPFNKAYASSYASGEILDNIPEEISSVYSSLVEKLVLKQKCLQIC